jgi:hypothetical protein
MSIKTKNSGHIVGYAAGFVLLFSAAILCESGRAPTEVDLKSGDIDSVPYPVPLLSVSVRGVKKKYKKADRVELRLILKNESSSDIYIFDRGGWTTSVGIVLKDHSTGADVPTSFVPLLLPPPPMSARDFLKMIPGQRIEGKVALLLSEYDLETAHEYDLLVQYQGAVPKKMGFGLNLYSSEMPTIVAPPVSIEIVSH